MGSNPVGDASGGQRKERGGRNEGQNLALRYRMILKMLLNPKMFVQPLFTLSCRPLVKIDTF